MSEFFSFRRGARKPAPWRPGNSRHERSWIGGARQIRTACRRIAFSLSRRAGFVALAAMAGGALLLHNEHMPASFGRSEHTPDRHSEFRDGSRLNATATDGDSLRAGNQKIRLSGIDAPELSQTCRDERGREWACGREAHARLLALLSRGAVNCASSSRDRYGRALATCSAGPVSDIGEAMVRAGYAVDFMNGGYQAAEAEARAEKRGIWRGSFERPQDWRRRTPHGADRG